jgi:hypothetical protein
MTIQNRFSSATALSLIALGSFCFASCSSNDTPSQPGTLPVPASTPQAIPSAAPTPTPTPTPTVTVTPFAFMVGTYGGTQVEFTFHQNGSATLKFACANGQIPAPIPVDSFGNFNAPGSYQGTDGPVPVGGYTVDKSSYYGIVNGDDLQLYANYTDAAGNVTAIGPFALTFGHPGDFSGVVCAD